MKISFMSTLLTPFAFCDRHQPFLTLRFFKKALRAYLLHFYQWPLGF